MGGDELHWTQSKLSDVTRWNPFDDGMCVFLHHIITEHNGKCWWGGVGSYEYDDLVYEGYTEEDMKTDYDRSWDDVRDFDDESRPVINGRELIKGNITESEDFDWIKDTQPRPMDPYIGKTFTTSSHDYTYRIEGYYDDKKVEIILIYDGGGTKSWFVDEKRCIEHIEGKRPPKWFIGTSNLNESDDLDWIKDQNPTPLDGTKFVVDYDVNNDHPIIYTIEDRGESYVIIKWKNFDGGNHTSPYHREEVEEYLNDGSWVMVG